MKRTKLSLVILAMAAASLMASCKKNNTPKDGFTASIELDSDSKTFLNGLQVKWSDYDQINVANTASTNIVFELTSGGNKTSGEFHTGDSRKESFFEAGGPYKAVYPATNTISGTTATVTLPATQNILADGTFGVGYNPMVAYSTDQTLPFRNLCGALCFKMVGKDITVKTLVLTTGNSSDRLSGTFTVNCNSSDPIMGWSSGGGNTITLTCPGSGIALSSDGITPKDFYFMLPPGTLHGLTLTAKDASNNVVYTATSTNNYTVTRNVIIKPDVDHVLEVPLKVTTANPTEIEIATANGGVTSVTNGTAAETGICWALSTTTTTPTISNSHKAGATGTTINMTDLTPGTDYYVRAYAKTAKGNYYYGNAILFATKTDYDDPGGSIPTGALPYVFSVSDSQKVYFSRGNLQYQASTETWRFAEDQWIFVGSRKGTDGAPVGMLDGSDHYYISSTYSGWIDLFGWGTSGIDDYTPRAVCYQPYSTSNTYSDYRPYNSTSSNLYTSPGKADWGYNAISNGGNKANSGWRTWTKDEMIYLLDTRVQTYRFAQAQIATPSRGVNGLMIFPDGFTWPSELSGLTLTCNSHTGPSFYNDNHITEVQWSIFERYGVAFLPACGYRGKGGVMNDCHTQGRACRYWTSTRLRDDAAVYMDFGDHYWNVPSEANLQSGQGVRLIKNQ